MEAYSQDSRNVATACLLGIFIEFQQTRAGCDLQFQDIDVVIDAAIPQIEEHLIAEGEVTRQQVDEQKSMTSMWSQAPEQSAQMCTEAGAMREHFTPKFVTESTNSILAAGAGQFTSDCI